MIRAALRKKGEGQMNRVVMEALHALAQLGATESLPEVEAAATRPDFLETERSYARIARARLIAEAGDKRPVPADDARMEPLPPPQVTVVLGAMVSEKKPVARQKASRKLSTAEKAALQQARTKLDSYLKELSIGVKDLNRTRTIAEAQKGIVDGTWSPELLMLRELADMIYQKHDIALAQVCEETKVEFEQDTPSKLKVNLAAYSQKERIKALVAHIAQTKVLGGYEEYIMQLLINEGVAGSSAAAEQLKVVQKNRSKYTRASIVGFFRVIQGVGDTAQAAVVESFRKDEDIRLASYVNQSLPDIKDGTPHRLISPY